MTTNVACTPVCTHVGVGHHKFSIVRAACACREVEKSAAPNDVPISLCRNMRVGEVITATHNEQPAERASKVQASASSVQAACKSTYTA